MTGIREQYPEIDSTQDRAIALARGGAEEGTRVVADRQTRGRGRRGHSWVSPRGNLYLSIVLAAPEAHADLLPVAIGGLIAERLGRACPLPLRLKWPNDIVVVPESLSVRKLGGILVDRVPAPHLGWAAVAGIGINVDPERSSWPPPDVGPVASLHDLLRPSPLLTSVESWVVEAALEASSLLREGGGAKTLLDRCRAVFWGIGERVRVDGVPAGVIVGLGDDGVLLVENDGVRTAVRTGELTIDPSRAP